MKISSFALTATALVLSSTAWGLPSLFKRAGDKVAVVGCFIQLFSTRSFSTSCSQAVKDDVGLVEGISLDDLTLTFTPGEPISLSSAHISVKLLGFAGFTAPITKAKMNITLNDNGVDIAYFVTPVSLTTLEGTSLTTSLLSSPVVVIPGAMDRFINFAVSLLLQPSVTILLKGTADVTVSLPSLGSGVPGVGRLPFGSSVPIPNNDISLTGVGFSSSTSLAGVGIASALSTVVEFVSQSSFVHDASTGEFTLTWTLNFKNPSSLTLDLGDFNVKNLDATSKLEVGVTTFQSFKAIPGTKSFTAVTVSSSKDLFTALTTSGTTLVLQGSAESSKDPILAGALTQIQISVQFPVLKPDA